MFDAANKIVPINEIPQNRIDELTEKVLWECVVNKGVGYRHPVYHSSGTNYLRVPYPSFSDMAVTDISSGLSDSHKKDMADCLRHNQDKLIGDNLDIIVNKVVKENITPDEIGAFENEEIAIEVYATRLKTHLITMGIGSRDF